jgi:hypothetical protein
MGLRIVVQVKSKYDCYENLDGELSLTVAQSRTQPQKSIKYSLLGGSSRIAVQYGLPAADKRRASGHSFTHLAH